MEKFETVYTVTEYYDGPREGIADFGGRPHFYQSNFGNFDTDDKGDIFFLQPVDAYTLQLAIEDWNIWLRWQEAYNAGLTDLSTHPALPDERTRHEELLIELELRLIVDRPTAIRAIADFQTQDGNCMVRWKIR
jgi:hypothetical protein